MTTTSARPQKRRLQSTLCLVTGQHAILIELGYILLYELGIRELLEILDLDNVCIDIEIHVGM
jgi:hypothetical protein